MNNDFLYLINNYNFNKIKPLYSGENIQPFRIILDQARYPLNNLVEIFSNYILDPSYQRKRVWDERRKSRLIESLILNVPVPAVFLYESDYNKYEVMDGLQRISTIMDFILDKFRLEGLDVYPHLNGLRYSQLPSDIQNSINRRYLSATIILKESSAGNHSEEEMKQFIFERLNTGGMELTAQEIRNAIYGGEFNDMLFEVAHYKNFRELINLPLKARLRMEDNELILRFFAFKNAINSFSSIETKRLLDLYAKLAKNLNSSEAKAAADYYCTVLDIIYDLFGPTAFTKGYTMRFERMIYDTLILSISNIIDMYGEEIFDDIQLENMDSKKFEFFNQNRQIFNGRETRINNVLYRVDAFTEFLKREMGIG